MKTMVQKAGIAVSGLVLVLMIFNSGRSLMLPPESQLAESLGWRQIESEVTAGLQEEIHEEQLRVRADTLVPQWASPELARNEIAKVVRTEFDAAERNFTQPKEAWNADSIRLLAKLLFSLLFGVCALYIVLSNKYPDDTQKWAFSVLTLIAGVWIGSL